MPAPDHVNNPSSSPPLSGAGDADLVLDIAHALHPVEGINPEQPAPLLGVSAAPAWSDYAAEGSPPFINRKLSIAEWGAYVSAYQFGSLEPSRLVLHHTYRPDETTWAGLASMRGMQRFYAGKGWTSAPHIYCAPDGIWLATPMSRIGIHAGRGNGSVREGWYSIGVEMVGFFDTRLPSGSVWRHTLAVLSGLARRLGKAPDALLSFHRDYTDEKTCPGSAVSKAWVLQEWAGVSGPPPATHRARLWAPVFEAPPTATRQPRVAWQGRAVLAPGQAVPLSETTVAGWLHWPPNGFVEAAAVEVLPPTPAPARPVYTPDSPLLAPAWGDEAGYVAAFVRYFRAGGTPYDDASLTTIARAYWREATAVGADPWLLAAQVAHETGRLTAALSLRQDKDGRPLRNPAGIGVYEAKANATPHHRPSTVWDGDVQGYRPCVGFASWERESVPAHVGRYVAYATKPGARRPEQQALIDRAFALGEPPRPLPDKCHGSATTLALLGSGPNEVAGCGWAGAGDGQGGGYGAGLARHANGLVAQREG